MSSSDQFKTFIEVMNNLSSNRPGRDPARIDEILKLLGELWKLQPDSRLCQMIYNTTRPLSSDIFNIEDDKMVSMIKAEIERISK